MANWQRTLNLLPQWKEAKEGAVSIPELARVVHGRLIKLEPFNDHLIDDERDIIADEFDDIAKDKDASRSSFDEVMAELYDWADTVIDSKWPTTRVCWVRTF